MKKNATKIVDLFDNSMNTFSAPIHPSKNELIYSWRYYSLIFMGGCLIFAHPKVIYIFSKIVFKIFKKEK
jgi:hypothetical protein